MSRSWDVLRNHWPQPADAVEYSLLPAASVAILVCHGRPPVSHSMKMVHELLTQSAWRPGFDVIADLSCAEGPARMVIAYIVAHREHFTGRLAIVAPDDAHKDVMEALGNLPAQRMALVRVFPTPDALRSWLGCS
jgi:hypothetical protein